VNAQRLLGGKGQAGNASHTMPCHGPGTEELREVGLEPPSLSPQTPIPATETKGRTEGCQLSAQSDRNRPIQEARPGAPIDSDLAAVVASWPALPGPIRAGIVAMVRAAGGVSK
jgi:hypothetical protein